MQVTVKLNPVRGAATEGVAQLRTILSPFKLEAVPLHPGAADPTLQDYYTVETPDPQVAAVLAQLRASHAVEGAYLKPTDALP